MNPFKKLREQHNITQETLARVAGVTTQSILRYEQGLYEKPSDKIVNALSSLTGAKPPVLKLKYEIWRRFQQERASPIFVVIRPLQLKPGEHPFITFRTNQGYASRMAFCKLLAIHPSVVADYEKGRQKHMPRMIKQALINADCREEILTQLDQFGVIYYDRLL